MKFLDLSGLTSVLSKLTEKISVAYDNLEVRVTANETEINNKLSEKGGTISGTLRFGEEDYDVSINKKTIFANNVDVNYLTSINEAIQVIGDINSNDSINANEINTDSLCTNVISNGSAVTAETDFIFANNVDFEGEVNFSYYGIINVSNNLLNAEPGQIYVYSKAQPIEELNITLTKIESSRGNDYTFKFVPAVDDMPITITDGTSDDILWHNEPNIIGGKAYTLAVSIVGSYKEAVLSYAE